MLVNHARYFKKISGIGDSLVKSLDDYFGKHYEEMWELSQEFNFNVQHTEKNGTSLSGMSFVITGSLNKFKNRDALKEKIESLGGKVAGSVSSKTTVLINNDVESSSSKNKKAKSLRLTNMVDDPRCTFALHVGTKKLIKRQKFEEFINSDSTQFL